MQEEADGEDSKAVFSTRQPVGAATVDDISATLLATAGKDNDLEVKTTRSTPNRCSAANRFRASHCDH